MIQKKTTSTFKIKPKRLMRPRLTILKTDITELDVDAIVNAANKRLAGGGGVDGAIHNKGGIEILRECQEIVTRQGFLETGKAVSTSAGNLPSKYVIHTVGPIYSNSPQDKEQLASCYTESLRIAQLLQVKTIAFPNISTGIYGYPKAEAASVAISTVRNFIDTKAENNCIEEIIFVCFDEENFKLYQQMI